MAEKTKALAGAFFECLGSRAGNATTAKNKKIIY
jgi:hypothetical protein